MYRFSAFLALLFYLFGTSISQAEGFDFSDNKLLVLSNGDAASLEAAKYFFYHLDKRNLNKEKLAIAYTEQEDSSFERSKIYIEIVPDLDCDYEIINAKGQLSIYGKDRAVLRWISYMLIDYMAIYHQLDVSDLVPNYVDFKTGKVNFAFQYRDPHLRPNMDQDISGMLFTNNVDRDWSIWGHNLGKVFPVGYSNNIYALVGGKRDNEQYCFSAIETKNAIVQYIVDNHGIDNRNPQWFTISPNDNDKVCMCDACLKLGNKTNNATPAVIALMNQLGEQFPKDHFYTIGYRTTEEAPLVNMAPNTGVLLSTVNISKAPILDKGNSHVRRFSTLLGQWKKKTPAVYLWDYISNFDEYLTPFPNLMRVQEQLLFFKNEGVDGIFMNGSGYDYAPFDDVKTYVLSAIMIDPSLSVNDLVKRYYERFYPVSGTLISDYFLDMEKGMYDRNMNIDMYSSFRTAMLTYLNPAKFKRFYADLIAIEGQLKGNEYEQVDQLISALSYVQLQLNYHQGSLQNGFLKNSNGIIEFSSDNDATLVRLRKALTYDILNYKEEKGELKIFLKEWDELKKKRYPINKIKSIQAKGIFSGEEIDHSTLLYDNIKGFESDFHQGWFLAGEDVLLSCELNTLTKRDAILELSFLINKRHRMLSPQMVEVLIDGKIVHTFGAADFEYKENVVNLKKEIAISNGKKLEIKIYKSREVNKSIIASDEIQLY